MVNPANLEWSIRRIVERLCHASAHSVKNHCPQFGQRSLKRRPGSRFMTAPTELACNLAAIQVAATAKTDFETRVFDQFNEDHGRLSPVDFEH